MSKPEQNIVDFDSADEKVRAVSEVMSATGLCVFECRRLRDQRSNNQNRYFHGPMLREVAKLLRQLWGEPVNKDRAKKQVKEMFLRVPVHHHETGALLTWETRDTHELNTVEFNDLIDRVRAWAWSHRHFIEEPNPNWRLTQTEAA